MKICDRYRVCLKYLKTLVNNLHGGILFEGQFLTYICRDFTFYL
uniref:Uncharacterized protein n=1 Tax=Rhizophora mucronata TaxID=61149 RepID=A0A2P2K3K0_RHIMU